MNAVPHLTRREKEVLSLIASDFTSKELASNLCISLETVKSHRKNLIKKLKVKTSGGLVSKGFELGILKV